jgi:hypothetical protein
MLGRYTGVCRSRLALAALLLALGSHASSETPKPPVEPRLLSVYPLGDRPGSTYDACLRGFTLRGAQAVWFESDSIHARIDGNGRDPESDPHASTPTDILNIHVTIDASAKSGAYPFRVVTKQGVSNAISMRVTDERTVQEPEASTGDPDQAPRLSAFPLVVNGRIAKKGQVDYYAIDARPGEDLSFQAVSGFSAFDPALAILEPSGSWFDPHRLNRIAFNDEPLYYPDFSTDALLVRRFDHSGRYLVSVASFEGQASPNNVYQLHISMGRTAAPSLRALPKPGWQEHTFTRHFAADWLAQLRERGNPLKPPDPLETFRAVNMSSTSPPLMKVPGVVEGTISEPGETQKITFQVKEAQDLVLELETPDATVPRFNPVIRVLDSAGHEVVTNVYTQLNNCGGFMMKTAQPKTVASFRGDSEYTLEVHDITTDSAGPNFGYRVLIRPLVPHLGKVTLEEERVNLKPGGAKPLSVEVEREESYSGLIALSVEGLPTGVQAVAGSEPEAERPPLMNGGKVDRYFPKKQKSVLLLTAAPDAPVTAMPQMARVLVRPIVEGKVAAPVATELVPVMVVAASTEIPSGKP